MQKIFCFNFLLFILPFFAYSQKANFQFYTTDDGLSGNLIHGIAEDNQGFIWVCNDSKLQRFDGRNFVLFSPPAELPGSDEGLNGPFLYEDSLLLMISKSYVFLMNPRTGGWESFPAPFKKQENKHLILGGAFKNGDPSLIILSENGDSLRLLRFHNRSFEPTGFKDIQLDLLGVSFVAPNDSLYIYHGNTMKIYDEVNKKIKEVSFQDILRGGDIVHAILNADGYLNTLLKVPVPGTTLYNNFQVYLLPDISKEPSPHPVNRFLSKMPLRLSAALPEKNGSLWLCGPDRHLLYYDAVEDTLFNYTAVLKELLPDVNDIIYPFIDRAGTAWILTRLGLLKVSLHEVAFDEHFDQPTETCNGYCSFRGFTEDVSGHIYSSFYNGIVQFEPVQKKVIKVVTTDDIPLPFPSGLFADSNGLWLNNGQLLDMQSGGLQMPPGAKINVAEEGLFAAGKNGRLWWAVAHELFYLNTENGQVRWEKELELPHKGAYMTDALYVGPHSGDVLISHRGNLLQYEPATKKQTWYDPLDWGLPVARILAIEEDGKGWLWLATDMGLVRFDPTMKAGQTPASSRAKLYTTEDGLPNSFVCGMLSEGDSCLWLSTNHGLSRFHIASESFVNFFEEDGLTDNEFNRKSYFKASDGRMFFGGLRGVNAFVPEELMQNYRRRNEAAQVALSSFEFVDEKKDTTYRHYNFTQQPIIHIYHWQRSFTFEYALTDFSNPQEIAYSYQMEGYESRWSVPSKFNFTRFSSLPSGQYVFRVKARDSHGLWHPHELAVKVVVHPPWWATWWAYLTYGLIGTTILYFLRRYEINRQTLKTNLMIETVETEKLKELDAFKSRLYTNLTHEFRTPLTVILGMADQIEEDPPTHFKNGIQAIRRNGKSLLRLINQLLDLSKLENNSFQLNLQQGDIVPYLRYVTESFQSYANGRNLSLRFFTTLESLVMDFDPEQIKQVMTNLISNAIKFTSSGGEVKVKTGKLEIGKLEITVSDTGIGIPEKDLPHIFDRFYQVDGSHTRKEKGTGIGLAHSQEIVKLLGGTISAESELGNGTVFRVVLPVTNNAKMEEGHYPADPWQEEAPATIPETTEHSPFTIHHSTLPTLLIVEDNPDVVLYLKSCLENDYQLEVAYNGKIGIEKALEIIPDIIISDIMMPEKNGFEVTQYLKNDERTSHIPIILLTAKADVESKIAGLERGADAYLAKPFEKKELLVRLKMLIEIRKKLQARYTVGNLLSLSAPAEKPDLPPVAEPDFQIEDAFLQKVNEKIEKRFPDSDFEVADLCRELGMSQSQLYRKIKALTTQSIVSYVRSFRLHKGMELLKTTNLTISEVAYQVGFSDISYFSRAFSEEFGNPPTNFRN